jgi:hypothetical protein
VKARSTAQPLAPRRRGELGGRRVLADIAGLEPRGDDALDARRRQRGRLGAVTIVALLQRQADPRRMRDDRRRRLARGDGAELSRRLLRAQRLLAQRGDDLAMDRHGDFGRADRADVEPDRRMDARDPSGASKPAAFSRSTRLACVFREPSAPI